MNIDISLSDDRGNVCEENFHSCKFLLDYTEVKLVDCSKGVEVYDVLVCMCIGGGKVVCDMF